MEEEKRVGRQEPTTRFVLPYTETKGQDAIELYNQTGSNALDWQVSLIYDILGIGDDGLWVHGKFGYSVPRQNGKNEIIVMRELFGLTHGEVILHTAHKTTTSGVAFRRLCKAIEKIGILEKKGPVTSGYRSGKSKGQEFIELDEEFGGGRIDFRTRTTTGGLGETIDTLIIDEAQEYQTDQEEALQYTITTSKNPQILMCGTPPTPNSSGTVFTDYRKDVLCGAKKYSGWAEWSVNEETDPNDTDAWYETNPSLGILFGERVVEQQIGSTNEIDFNIQRLGLWIKYNQKSAISRLDWDKTLVASLPNLTGPMNVGIKYNRDGENVSMAIAIRTTYDKIFVEVIDCRPIREGNKWIVDFICKAKDNINRIVIDGESRQAVLEEELKQYRIKGIVLPTVGEYIKANANFEKNLFAENIVRMDQPSLTAVVTNCEKRAIGSHGGFGFQSIRIGNDISLMDSIILASWASEEFKERRKQHISY